MTDYKLPVTDTSKSSKTDLGYFGSTMAVGDYAMPRAGKTSDYMTSADKKYNPGVK